MAHQFPRPSESLGEPLTIVRGIVVQGAADAFAEAAIALPTNPANNIGFLVRRVLLSLGPQDFAIVAAGTTEQPFTQAALSTRQGLGAIPAVNDDGVIAVVQRVYNTATIAASTGGWATVEFTEPPETDYSIGGLLTASREVSLYMDSNRSIAVQFCRMILLGHLVEVTADELIAALSTEVGI